MFRLVNEIHLGVLELQLLSSIERHHHPQKSAFIKTLVFFFKQIARTFSISTITLMIFNLVEGI